MERRLFIKSLMAFGGCAACAGIAFADEEWGYDGAEAPKHWGELDPHNLACATGSQQSPLDIAGEIAAKLPKLELDWEESDGTMVNNGHTIQIDVPAGSALDRDGEVYELKQFHFHTPSEHHVKGRAFPMEAHFVHQNRETGSFGVLAVFFAAGAANEAFARLARTFPAHRDDSVLVDDFDPRGLLPGSLDYWLYEGSLTTPPCSEDVDWIVLKEPLRVSEEDIARFRAIIPHNARPIVLPHRRFILSST
ncbi:carbonic anhydrase family protein [Chelativorans sp. AA-79]|uniref:carbonic anhydrase n=1 Tax=Chelativorans sp. AA-79 TaxID=3028735 RepID=UPI0023F6C1B9|nr:carbonic anhydrase family protein [Chelativorans sp. AA-79]WEX11973.1 carbonic anhydrase family protein [Chelativorans sp. AA-79]